jgi:hypothetical protein
MVEAFGSASADGRPTLFAARGSTPEGLVLPTGIGAPGLKLLPPLGVGCSFTGTTSRSGRVDVSKCTGPLASARCSTACAAGEALR